MKARKRWPRWPNFAFFFFNFLSLTVLASQSAYKAEIKIGLSSEDFFKVLEAHELLFDQAVEGFNYFYDTLDLDLYKNGLIARGRIRYGSKDSFTLKIRPIDFETVHKDWFDIKGFECEYDVLSTKAVSACRIAQEREGKHVLNVARGLSTIESLVSQHQTRFVSHFLGAAPAWDVLAILGPIRTFVWGVRFAQHAPKATLEYWILPDGRATGEVSIRVASEDVVYERERLLEYLRALGITKFDHDEAKTAWAMHYFATRLKQAVSVAPPDSSSGS